MNLLAKLKNRWRTVVLGLGAGLFSSGLCLIAYRIDKYYLDLEAAQERAQSFLPLRCAGVMRSPFWWVEVTGFHIAIYVIATLVVYRFLSKRETSVFILWQYIGLSVFVGWVLALVIGNIPDVLDGMPFHLISPVSPFGLKLTAVAFAANVIYGTAIHVFAKRRDG